LLTVFLCRLFNSQRVEQLENQSKELTVRYDTALEIIGAKEEEIQELRADIIDMKTMFRQQVSELLDRVEQLQKSQK
jgi:hypothetical protein